LCNVGMFNVAFTAGEITEHYASRRIVNYRNLSRSANIIHYTPILPGDSTSSVDDVSSNNYNGTPQNMESTGFIPVRQYELIA
jgi:hypothetical protein